MLKKSAFSGSCHWCTEAIFESLLGVEKVDQGWAASDGKNSTFSEAVIVTFEDSVLSLETLIAVHLHTHHCTAVHSMRDKYRSAVYTFSDDDIPVAKTAILRLQKDFEAPIITEVMRFCEFKSNREEQLHYYFTDSERPFCKTYINPKLRLILEKFSDVADKVKLKHLKS